MTVRDALLLARTLPAPRRDAIVRYAVNRGLTIRDAAELLGVNTTTTHHYIGGRVDRRAILDDRLPRELEPDVGIDPMPGQTTLA